jgi:hypothetical protein
MNAVASNLVNSSLGLRLRRPASDWMNSNHPMPGAPIRNAVANPPLNSRNALRPRRPASDQLNSNHPMPGAFFHKESNSHA